MIKRFFVFAWVAILSHVAAAQSPWAPLNDDYYHLVDRELIKQNGVEGFHMSVKGIKRSEIGRLLDSSAVPTSRQDLFNRQYLANDNSQYTDLADTKSKKPFLKYFYKEKTDFVSVDVPNFQMKLNPIINLTYGVDSEVDYAPFTNTRGLELSGVIGEKVGFYSMVTENQIFYPWYVKNYVDSMQLVPHEGFWKQFSDDGVDFLHAQGYFTFQAAKVISISFGHDRFKIGNGYRSVVLSDFSPAYLFLKLNTQVWKISYTNIFARHVADVFRSPTGTLGNDQYPEKYSTTHHLSYNITPKINIGLFESVIFSRQDSLGNNNFDIAYLNPIIFYRALEQQNGSADNAMVGMDFTWMFLNRFSLYGQFVLDELVSDELFSDEGWWGNKFGYQLGMKYIDVLGVSSLDIQAEYNFLRPYTYSHKELSTTYSGYLQPLAHPIGANLREVVLIGYYQPLPRMQLRTLVAMANYGTDAPDTNYGGDILKDPTTRESDYGNTVGQGVSNQLFLLDFTATYQWKHNFFIEGEIIYRTNDNALTGTASGTTAMMGVRWNIARRTQTF